MTGSLRWQKCAKEKGSDLRPDYRVYQWTRREAVGEVGKAIMLLLAVCLYFYRSLWAVLPLGAAGRWYYRMVVRKKVEKQRRELLLQFRDMIRAVEGALKTGYSLENAFRTSYGDMCAMHGEGAMISRELLLLRRGLEMNVSLERLLEDLAKRSGLPQIEEFASVLSVAVRSGGNVARVIAEASEQIQRMAELQEEIMVQTAQKRLERGIMLVMPFGILTYIGVSSRGYFDSLYHNAQGILIMSGCLGLYLTAYAVSEKILAQALDVWKER